LNDEENRNSLFTPKANLLQVPRPVPGICLGVKYQAKHRPILLSKLDEELELPETLYGALTAFIAWKIYSNLNTQEAGAKAQEYEALFESICNEAVMTDVVSTSIATTNIKFHQRGWR